MSENCTFCKNTYNSKYNLNKHLIKVHNVIPSDVSNGKSFSNHKCLECNSYFKQNAGLVKHLETVHKFEILKEEIHFNSMEEFTNWKKKREEEEVVNYIRTRGKRILNSGSEMFYFTCNRSGRVGNLQMINKRKRLSKSQGSCKINNACISQMTVIRDKTGEVHMSRVVTHYGHRNELQHVRINTEDRKAIASKLMNGMQMKEVLNEKRSNIGGKLKRIDLLTLEDINNIRKRFKVSKTVGLKHRNDPVSVESWVKQCEEQTQNPIILYKKEGVEAENFKADYFCLIIMDKFQEEMFKKHGSNIVVIDSTQGQGRRDLEMTTALVVDEYGEGFPVAEMFTNRKDTQVYSIFLDALKSRVGVIHANTFMSDVTLDVYNAWRLIMGPVKSRLYCSWHVDRDWRKNLSKIRCKRKQENVYKTLKLLQYNLDSNCFIKDLSQFTKTLFEDNDTKDFGIYFIKNYAYNTKLWALCYWDLNINIKLESMHKVIRNLYLNKRTIEGFDTGLHAVLQYIRDKTVNLLIRCTKEKYTGHKKQIIERHKAAETTSFKLSKNDNEWKVTDDDGKDFIVKQLALKKCCKLSCVLCNICVHTYSCTCSDYTIGCLICKHIHYVAKTDGPVDDEEEPINDNEIESNFFISPLDQSNEKQKLIEEITNKITTLHAKLNSKNLDDIDKEHLSQILSHLNNFDAILDQGGSKNGLLDRNNEKSSEVYVEDQDEFYSVVKNNSAEEFLVVVPDEIFTKNINLSSNYEQYDHDYIKCTSR